MTVKGCNQVIPPKWTFVQETYLNLNFLAFHWGVLLYNKASPLPSSPHLEPVSMTTWCRRGLPAGGRVSRSSVGITAWIPHTASRPEWNGRKRQERACTYLRFVGFMRMPYSISAKNLDLNSKIFAFGIACFKNQGRTLSSWVTDLFKTCINKAIVPVGTI